MKLQNLPNRLSVLKPVAQVATVSDSWRAGKSSTQRGYGYKWKKARAAFLAQHPLCVYCLEKFDRVTAANVVDHIVPHKGDKVLFWDRSNWQSLCATCHSSTKQKEENNQ